MIKGINKQIIEIRCTNDEYFERILLFVRADKADMPYGVLKKGAENCCGKLLPNSSARHSRAKAIWTAAVLILALAILGAVYLFAIL
ncbi:MAG: hypothetical protein LUE12_04705 [Ruminococcus sp.]|nr:hypothetical protein [Ruminococcus sp.]